MRCLGCMAYKDEKCTAGIIPYKSKKETDGVGCNCNRKTVAKRIKQNNEQKGE